MPLERWKNKEVEKRGGGENETERAVNRLYIKRGAITVIENTGRTRKSCGGQKLAPLPDGLNPLPW